METEIQKITIPEYFGSSRVYILVKKGEKFVMPIEVWHGEEN